MYKVNGNYSGGQGSNLLREAVIAQRREESIGLDGARRTAPPTEQATPPTHTGMESVNTYH